MIFAPGDALLLERLYDLRFASSGQLSRATKRSSQVLRRRLRKLAEAGFVLPLTQRPGEQAAYALAEGGFDWIAHQRAVSKEDLPFSRKISQNQTASIFWRHALLVGDIVIAFQEALEEHPRLGLTRVIREWELADPRARAHHRRFVLSERYEERGQVHVHRPDACLLLCPRQAPEALQAAAYIEADRGTERMKIIRRKIEAFYLVWKSERYRALGASGMRVLFVLGRVQTNKRIRSIQSTLKTFCHALERRHPQAGAAARAHALAFADLFRFTRSEYLRGDVMQDPIWHWGLGQTPDPFLRPDDRQLALPFPAKAMGVGTTAKRRGLRAA